LNTNALGYQKTTTKNAIGKIIRIDEPESAWLTHQHDAIGNLTQTNVGGVTTTMTYDNRGNKISVVGGFGAADESADGIILGGPTTTVVIKSQ
jgi:YD repeat-containing protein